ncbi:MAG: Uma2 family endonuclease [Chitinophagales bacterium]|nr:Uma2 family endonuclease [Chitinophagales bacterium]
MKRKIYEKYGVDEYVITDPDNKECYHYILRDGAYAELEKCQQHFFRKY